jgi:non-homologous end joining protein Ku
LSFQILSDWIFCRYHAAAAVEARRNAIVVQWAAVTDRMKERRTAIVRLFDAATARSELDAAARWINDMTAKFTAHNISGLYAVKAESSSN